MVDLSALGQSSGGLWTRQQALALSTAGLVRSALTSRSWQVVWPGVHCDAGFDLTAEQRCWAAVLASGGAGQPLLHGGPDPVTGRPRRRLRAVACGRTAARFWGLPLVDDDDPATGASERLVDEVHVWAHLPALRHDDRVLERRRLHLGPSDIHRTADGLFVTSPLRTVLDLSASLPLEASVCALDAALHRGSVTVAELDGAVAGRRGQPWSRAVASAVAAADGRAESPIETLTRLLLLPALPELEPQVELRDRGGRVLARFDLADRRRRLAVEGDGKAAHSGPAMVAKDRARDLRSEEHGWVTERVTWYDVRCRQVQTRARVVARAEALDRRSDRDRA